MKSFLVFIALFSAFAGHAQDKKEVKEADKLFKEQQYKEALPLYKKFINMDANNVDYIYKYGCCVLMVTDKTDEGLQLLLKAEKLGKSDLEVAYFIARAYEKKQEFNKAISYYERFTAVASKEQLKNLKVKSHIKFCKKSAK